MYVTEGEGGQVEELYRQAQEALKESLDEHQQRELHRARASARPAKMLCVSAASRTSLAGGAAVLCGVSMRMRSSSHGNAGAGNMRVGLFNSI